MAPGQPANIIALINRIVRVSRQMFTETGREPTIEELAARLALPLDAVRRLYRIARGPIGSGP